MPRYAVIEHHWNGVHWDFLLEAEGVLLTWALSEEPNSALSISATKLADHRIIYLDYEGEISGGRGHVRRWDGGEYAWLEHDPRSVRVS